MSAPGRITREAVVEAAARRFRDAGYGAVSVRGVAEDLSVTAPALYRHFRDRADLVAAVLEEGLQGLTHRLGQAAAAPTPAERLRATAGAILDFALAEPRVYQTLTFPADVPELRDVVPRLHDPVRSVGRFLSDRVRERMDRGTLAPGDPDVVALALWSHSHGLISMHLSLIHISEPTRPY